MDIFHERLNILYEECRDRDPACGRRKFASICQVSFFKVDNYLSGKGMPTIDTLRSIADNLQVNPLWLLGMSEEKCEDKRRLQGWINELNQGQIDEVLTFVKYIKFKQQFDEFIKFNNKNR